MVSDRYAKAMAEVLEYLKGIKPEDVEKISPQFLGFLKENAAKEYKSNIDYTKPLSELNLMEISKSIIIFISYKYWSETEEQKKQLINILNKNQKEWENNKFNIFEDDTGL